MNPVYSTAPHVAPRGTDPGVMVAVPHDVLASVLLHVAVNLDSEMHQVLTDVRRWHDNGESSDSVGMQAAAMTYEALLDDLVDDLFGPVNGPAWPALAINANEVARFLSRLVEHAK